MGRTPGCVYPGRWGSPNKHIYFISTYLGRQLGPGSRRSRGRGQVDRQQWREEGTCPWLPLRRGHPKHRQDGGIPALAAREERRGPFRNPAALEDAVSKASLSNACSLTPRAIARQPLEDGGPGAGCRCQGQSGLCLGSCQEEPCPRCPNARAPGQRMEGPARLHCSLSAPCPEPHPQGSLPLSADAFRTRTREHQSPRARCQGEASKLLEMTTTTCQPSA